jgi:hypothetical protein
MSPTDFAGLLRSYALALERHRWDGPADFVDFKMSMARDMKRRASKLDGLTSRQANRAPEHRTFPRQGFYTGAVRVEVRRRVRAA